MTNSCRNSESVQHLKIILVDSNFSYDGSHIAENRYLPRHPNETFYDQFEGKVGSRSFVTSPENYNEENLPKSEYVAFGIYKDCVTKRSRYRVHVDDLTIVPSMYNTNEDKGIKFTWKKKNTHPCTNNGNIYMKEVHIDVAL